MGLKKFFAKLLAFEGEFNPLPEESPEEKRKIKEAEKRKLEELSEKYVKETEEALSQEKPEPTAKELERELEETLKNIEEKEE